MSLFIKYKTKSVDDNSNDTRFIFLILQRSASNKITMSVDKYFKNISHKREFIDRITCIRACHTHIHRIYSLRTTPVVNFSEVRRAQLAKSIILTSTLMPLGSFKVCSDAKESVGRGKQREAIAPIHP